MTTIRVKINGLIFGISQDYAIKNMESLLERGVEFIDPLPETGDPTEEE